MAAFPALVQLVRLLGREATLAQLGLEREPDPDTLTDAQRETLARLLNARIRAVALELVQEAAASDDVTDALTGRAWLTDRIAGYRDIVGAEVAGRLMDKAATEIETWR